MIHIVDGQKDTILDYIPIDEFWESDSQGHYKSLKDTMETFDFTAFGDKDYSQHLSKRNRVVIPDEDGKYIEFIIENTRKYRDSSGAIFIDVYTVASYLELRKASVIKPQSFNSETASTVTGKALNGTEWRPGNIEGEGTRTFHIEQYTNPYSFTKRIATEFSLERNFRVEHNGNKITGRYLDMLERVGQWQGREVEFGSDLIGIERNEDTFNVVTALIGIGPEREDGTRLEVFVEDEDALQRWGRRNPQTGELMHIIDVYEPASTDAEMTENRLTELTRNELEKRVNSVVEYTADIADLEKVPGMENKKIRFGDTIKSKDVGFNPPLYLEARVHTQRRYLTRPANKKVTLGDYIEYTEEEVQSIWKQLQAQIAKKVSMSQVTEVVYTKGEVDERDIPGNEAKDKLDRDVGEAVIETTTGSQSKADQAENNANTYTNGVALEIREIAETAQLSADGKNAIFYEPTEPSVIGRKINDLWFDTSDDYKPYRFDGLEWVETPFGSNAIAYLDAGKISAESLSAISANLGTITAGTINGVSLEGVIIKQDGGTGKGSIILDNQGLKVYDSKNKMKASLMVTDVEGLHGDDVSLIIWQDYNTGNEVETIPALSISNYYTDVEIRAHASSLNLISEQLGVTIGTENPVGTFGVQVQSGLRVSGTTTPLRLESNYGYIEFGPKNASYAHLYTDRPKFYFSKPIYVNGNLELQQDSDIYSRHYYARGSYNCGPNGIYRSESGYVILQGTSGLVYLQSDFQVKATKPGTTESYIPVRASSFPIGSMAEYKQDIHPWEESALEKIRNTTIYEYRLKTEVEDGVERLRQGLVIGKGYNTPNGVVDGDGVEQYLMNSWSWKAIQELDKKQTSHEDRIAWLETENSYLKQKLKMLEGKIA